MAATTKLTGRNLAALAVLALCVELWMLFSDVHFLWKPEDVSPPRQLVAHIDAAFNRVMVRTPLQLSWRRAGSGQPLYEGDEIATLGESQAAITFIDSEKLQLGPNSLMQVRHAASVDRTVFQLSLVHGSIFQDKPQAGAPARESRFEIDVAGRKVVAGGTTGFNIVQNPNSESPVSIAAGGTVRDGATGAISLGGPQRIVPTGPPVAPALSEPDDGSTLVFNSPQIRLGWNAPAAPEPLTIEVARDGAFRQLVLRRRVDGQTSLAFRPPSKGVYHWRLVAEGIGGATAASPARVFELVRELSKPRLQRPSIDTDESAPAPKLEPPKLRKPSIKYQPGAARLLLRVLDLALSLLERPALADDTAAALAKPPKASAEEESHARYSVKLSWYGVTGAHAYTLQIATEPRFTQLVAEKILTEPNYTWRSNVAGFYYWRVAAVDAEGDRGPFSEFMTFDIKATRNTPGDETSYETFLRYDEYASHNHRFRLLAGPEYSNYAFVPNGSSGSPSTTRYSVLTARQAQAEYAYRIDNYFSVEATAKTSLSHIDAGAIQPSGNHNLNQNETTVYVGLERRIFEPHYYFSFEGGIRFSSLDLPVGPGLLTLNTFDFVGVQGQAGYHLPLNHDIELAFKAGPILLYGDQSLWYGGLFSEAFSKAVTDVFTVGMRFEEEASFYHLEADTLGGNAHRMQYDAYIFLEFNF